MATLIRRFLPSCPKFREVDQFCFQTSLLLSLFLDSFLKVSVPILSTLVNSVLTSDILRTCLLFNYLNSFILQLTSLPLHRQESVSFLFFSWTCQALSTPFSSMELSLIYWSFHLHFNLISSINNHGCPNNKASQQSHLLLLISSF